MKLSLLFFTLYLALVSAADVLQDSALSALAPRTASTKCVAKRTPSTKSCGVWGTINLPGNGVVFDKVTLQNCADSCTCMEGAACLSFAWSAIPKDLSLGRCTLYHKHLNNLGFKAGKSAKGPLYYDRTCFHKIKPTSSGAMTQAPSTVHKRSPTPTSLSTPHYMKGAELHQWKAETDEYIIRALSGL